MKKKQQYTGLLLATALLMAACGKEKASDPNDASRFTIAIEAPDNGGSKMWLTPDFLQLVNFDAIWVNGNVCNIINNALDGKVPAVPQGQYYLACMAHNIGLDTKIIPEGGILDNTYPAKAINGLVFPDFYTYSYDGGDYTGVPLVALVPHSSTTLTFKHLCSYIKVRIKASAELAYIDSIVVYAHNNCISGAAVVNFNSNTDIIGIYNRSRLGKDRYVTLYINDYLYDEYGYNDYMIPVMSRVGTDFTGSPTHLTITVYGEDEDGNPTTVAKTSTNTTALERKKVYTATFTPGQSGFSLGTGATYEDGGTVWNN